MADERAHELRQWIRQAVNRFGGENREWDNAVRLAFQQFPRNNRYEHIALKAAVVNQLYTARVLAFSRLVHHMADRRLRIDVRARRGDLTLVESIRSGHRIRRSNRTKADYYSFATKFCHFMNPASYPIYDRYAVDALRKSVIGLGLVKRVTVAELREGTKGYTLYRTLIDRLTDSLSLPSSYRYKHIDEGLWVLGQALHRRAAGSRGREYIRAIGPLPTWLAKQPR